MHIMWRCATGCDRCWLETAFGRASGGNGADRIQKKARLCQDAGAGGCRGPAEGVAGAVLRDPETCRPPAALRFPARARRGAEKLGGAEGAEHRSRRKAARGACRRPSARIWRVRGRHSRGPVRRRRLDDLGPRQLETARSRPASGLRKGQSQIRARRAEIARQMGVGADGRQACRPQQRELALDQGARRSGDAGKRQRSCRRESVECCDRPHDRRDRRRPRPDLGAERRGAPRRRSFRAASCRSRAHRRRQESADAGRPAAAAGVCGDSGAGWAGLAARDQVRRLSPAGADPSRGRHGCRPATASIGPGNSRRSPRVSPSCRSRRR